LELKSLVELIIQICYPGLAKLRVLILDNLLDTLSNLFLVVSPYFLLTEEVNIHELDDSLSNLVVNFTELAVLCDQFI
jgi:hypothetical protein